MQKGNLILVTFLVNMLVYISNHFNNLKIYIEIEYKLTLRPKRQL